ncbi:hypothetical protein [Agarivorans sp. B2Z047]|uniref:hypothetical protein n=1 Tax=Agarivorans sp. B2Z047 TaxID=2652721 RepID=UPI001884559F|nr:hypothetical protein [Agarivorans sp. B2Z047]UQN40812.1 hypothetical protein LQZ07_13595 [Agarivorans sp. B2Z047]
MRKFLALLFCFPCFVMAGAFTYHCEVKSEFVLTDTGTLKLENKVYVGSMFSVERKTGVVLGEGIENSVFPTKQVIDAGSKEQAYQLVWISHEVIGVKGAYNSSYLRIQEYYEGTNKPFILNLGYKTLTGICK